MRFNLIHNINKKLILGLIKKANKDPFFISPTHKIAYNCQLDNPVFTESRFYHQFIISKPKTKILNIVKRLETTPEIIAYAVIVGADRLTISTLATHNYKWVRQYFDSIK